MRTRTGRCCGRKAHRKSDPAALFAGLAVVVVGGCGRIAFDPTGDACSEPWSPAEEIVLGIVDPAAPSISSDDLELFVTDSAATIWVAQRADRTLPFEPATQLPAPINQAPEFNPSISDDGLDLYLTEARTGHASIVVSHRATRTSAFGDEVEVFANGSGDIAPGGLTMYAQDYKMPLLSYRRRSTADPFDPPVDLGSVINDGSTNTSPSISSDERALYFTSDRPGANAIWVATRADRKAAFETVAPVEIPGTADGESPEISADDHHLYFQWWDGTQSHVLVASRCE